MLIFTTHPSCWYLPKTREQFRIGGELLLVTAECALDRLCKARQEAWQQMSDAWRVQFAWATPGADRSPDPDAFNPAQPDAQPPPVGDLKCYLA